MIHQTISPPDQVLLSVHGLRHRWPEQQNCLLQADALHWYAGQCIWLRGQNGSGKSTLMRMLAGLEQASEGCFQQVRGRICYLHQTPYLFAGTVRDNLNFVIRSLRGRTRGNARAALQRGVEMAGLDALLDQNARTLSGGERQRLALLRAWLLQPEFLLLDEPAANLDEASVERMRHLVDDLLAAGSALMVSSHQQNLLTDLCNTGWLIEEGRLRSEPLAVTPPWSEPDSK